MTFKTWSFVCVLSSTNLYICCLFRTSLPAPMFSRNDFSIWSILRNCIGMVRITHLMMTGRQVMSSHQGLESTGIQIPLTWWCFTHLAWRNVASLQQQLPFFLCRFLAALQICVGGKKGIYLYNCIWLYVIGTNAAFRTVLDILISSRHY